MVQSPSWAANWFAASQEIPHISRNPKVHYHTHKRPPPVSILCQPNPVHIPTSHLLQIHPNIIHPSTPRSLQWSMLIHSSYYVCRIYIYIYIYIYSVQYCTKCVFYSTVGSLTFWRRNYFFFILAHPVYKMWIIHEPITLELWNKLNFEVERKTRRLYTMFKTFITYICWINTSNATLGG